MKSMAFEIQSAIKYTWVYKANCSVYELKLYFMSQENLEIIRDFFKGNDR